MSADNFERGRAAAIHQALGGSLDEHLIPCPRCGGQLRGEQREERRPIADAARGYGMTVDEMLSQLAAAGAKLDAFGNVRALVPYVTCMHCGFDADASTAAPAPSDKEGWL